MDSKVILIWMIVGGIMMSYYVSLIVMVALLVIKQLKPNENSTDID